MDRCRRLQERLQNFRNRLRNNPRIPDRRYSEYRPVRAAAGRARRLLSDNANVFCVCHRPFYGTMIRCDDPACRVVWYHINCVHINENDIPGESDDWYCPECQAP